MSLCIILQSNFEGAGGKMRGEGLLLTHLSRGKRRFDWRNRWKAKKNLQEILHMVVSECHILLGGREAEGEGASERLLSWRLSKEWLNKHPRRISASRKAKEKRVKRRKQEGEAWRMQVTLELLGMLRSVMYTMMIKTSDAKSAPMYAT